MGKSVATCVSTNSSAKAKEASVQFQVCQNCHVSAHGTCKVGMAPTTRQTHTEEKMTTAVIQLLLQDSPGTALQAEAA